MIEDKYVQGSLFDDEEEGFLFEVVWTTKAGYSLDVTKDIGDTEYTYTASDPNGEFLGNYTDKINILDEPQSKFFGSQIFQKFMHIIKEDMKKKYPDTFSSKSTTKSSTPKVLDKYKKETPYDTGYGKSSYSKYKWTPSYKTNTEEALKKYGKSNTLCFHKTDPTTTMLEQIYHGKGWDVVNDAYEMSPETIAALIDAHERIVMLGHGSSDGLIGFINPSHAKNLEPKKLFALWCNADAYCDRYLPNKKGFFACGNMPSDDGEASWVGFEVSHKYMDDNITYWCKLCGDVVEQCLEGDADAGCKYIRDKYWEKYHKGTADEVDITKYNYVRTKVAGQANLPEPEGEEVTAPKVEKPKYDYESYYSGYIYPKTTSYDIDDKVKSGDVIFTTTGGYECKVYSQGEDTWKCSLFEKRAGIKILDKTFGYIAKNGENVYSVMVKELGKRKLGDLIKDAEFKVLDSQKTSKGDKKSDVIAETDKGYTIIEKKQTNGYQYILMKGDKFIHVGSNPTKLKPEDAHSDFSAMLDIGNLI